MGALRAPEAVCRTSRGKEGFPDGGLRRTEEGRFQHLPKSVSPRGRYAVRPRPCLYPTCGHASGLRPPDQARLALTQNGSLETTMTTATLDFTKPHVLRNAREYKAAVVEIDRLLDRDPKRGSEEYDRLRFLSVLVEAYEDEHDPIDETGT